MSNNNNNEKPIIRRRVVKSQRQRNGLIQYAKDNTSQNGEDGIIAKIFEMLPPPSSSTSQKNYRYCVDVGAWDGRHLSNSYSLLVDDDTTTNHNDNNQQQNNKLPITSWRGVLIEADQERFQELKTLHEPLGNVCINTAVSCHLGSPQSLVSTLKTQAPDLPYDFDFLSIDVDGPDYWLLYEMLGGDNKNDSTIPYKPLVICIEANPTMPNDLVYIPPRNDSIRHGASLAALVELAESNGYTLIETTIYNAFLVQTELYQQYFKELVPDTSIEALHEITMGTSMYQLYDGTLKLWGCKKLLWHRCAIEERQIQVLKPEERNFPFSPPSSAMPIETEDVSDYNIVDMSPYCQQNNVNEDSTPQQQQQQQQHACADALINQLQVDGFALVNGTQISSHLCQEALKVTNSFLQDADESVRRSCLSTKDRARRGYSPMCTENFASLLGEDGPNDLVRKFRIGPIIGDDNDDKMTTTITTTTTHSPLEEKPIASSSSSSPLLRPNVWPTTEAWDPDSSESFRSTIEEYYQAISVAANAIVCAICEGLVRKRPDLSVALDKISAIHNGSNNHEYDGDDGPCTIARTTTTNTNTSILTLLGYRKGTRHTKKTQKKKRLIHPLVAAHTDVGIITVLLFDAGDCAVLQREDKKAAAASTEGEEGEKVWADVKLPAMNRYKMNNPTFVVNIADCMSDLSDGYLPSTIHRVMPSNGGGASTPRNCLALFVGLDPNERLTLKDGEMSYEEWRKQRIFKSQAVLKNKRNNDKKDVK